MVTRLVQLFLLTVCFGPSVRCIAQIGDPAPDFTVTDTHGEEHKLYEYLENGKIVVLDFFYTTCGPCIYYSPQAALAYEKYGCNTQDVIFLAIDFDDTDSDVKQYDIDNEIPYPSVSGLDGGGNSVVNAYGVNSFPRFYFIDSSKTIIDVVDPPTLVVFNDRFSDHGVEQSECDTNGTSNLIAESKLTSKTTRVWPNPSAGLVSFNTISNEKYTLQVVDGTGASIQIFDDVQNEKTIELSGLPNGVYTLIARSDNNIESHRLVIVCK